MSLVGSGEETFSVVGAGGRRYWIWVTGPEFYLDEDGADRRDLDPDRVCAPGDWWTCHRKTREGDLVLFYRSQVRKDIAYLIETRSNAYSLRNDEVAVERGWDVGCDYEVVEKFSVPLRLADMRGDPALAGWGPLRANFRRRVYEVPADVWDHLMGRLSPDRTGTERRRHAAARRFLTERDIESYLAGDLEVFARHGLRLELHSRQFVCLNGGRADLVCFEPRRKRYVAIELKKGIVGRNAVGQVLSYRASLEREFPSRRQPLGLLIGERMDTEAKGIVDSDSRLSFIPLSDLLHT